MKLRSRLGAPSPIRGLMCNPRLLAHDIAAKRVTRMEGAPPSGSEPPPLEHHGGRPLNFSRFLGVAGTVPAVAVPHAQGEAKVTIWHAAPVTHIVAAIYVGGRRLGENLHAIAANS